MPKIVLFLCNLFIFAQCITRIDMFSTLSKNSKSWLKVASFILITLVAASCGAGRTAISPYESSTIQDDLLAYSKRYLGKPYRYAGKGPNAFDCSGFTSFVFRNFGYRLSPSSAGQDRQVPTVSRKEDLRLGDLVFFEGGRRNGSVGHVGIVTEVLRNGQFRFIHASTTSGVIVSHSGEPYYAARYLRGGRVLEENASYATRQNPDLKKARKSVYPAAIEASTSAPTVAEVTPSKESSTQQKVSDPAETVVLVQTNPEKNAPLEERKNGSTLQGNNALILRESNTEVPSPPLSHVVKMGETLYSISRQYGCTVEQLKEWNPKLGTVLKTGDTLIIPI